jgi:WD repeat-containing protein 19
LELTFQESYGPIAQHLWFGDGFILMGFQSGQVVVVSSIRSGTVEDSLHRDYHNLSVIGMSERLSRCFSAESRVVRYTAAFWYILLQSCII